MSTFSRVAQRCALCGEEMECAVIKSTNEFGQPDLDLRPPRMRRDTMPLWIQKCPTCGYVAPDISKYEEIDMEYLNSEEYIHCEGLSISDRQCERFYQYYLLGKKRQNRDEQVLGLLYAIWTCDDNGEEALAVDLRKKAIFVLESTCAKDSQEQERNLLIRADLLRRSGQYQKLLDEYRDILLENDLHRKVLRFQLSRAEAQDSGRYTVQQAVINP